MDNGGAPIPDARIEIVLPEPLSRRELYPLYLSAAKLEGFSFLEGGDISPEQLKALNKRSYRFYRTSSDSIYQHSVVFSSPRGEKESSLVTFVFANDSTKLFTKKDWLAFYKWKEEYLPQVFSGSSMRVSIHPAIFTAREDVQKFSIETGIAIPEKYR